MKLPINASSRSATIKVAIIAVLTLVLLIPLGMIEGVIVDRQQNESVATADIRTSWGGDQAVTGPVLRLTYEIENKVVYGMPYAEERAVHLLADELIVDAVVDTDVRYRGIHEVPVFSAEVGIKGKVDLSELARLGIEAEQVRWNDATLFIGVSDPKSISRIPVVNAGGTSVDFVASRDGIAGLASELSAPLGKTLADGQWGSELDLDISLALKGSGSLLFLPLAENAAVTMSADWASPSFTGRQLPATREIREDGFDAAWNVTSLGRLLPTAWVGDHAAQHGAADDAFGARFMQPVGLYQLIDRATKYAVLIVGLTFVAYFLMEVVASLRLHPLQYLLVGLANTLFYLLLLSLSEHTGFDLAYAISALASAALIAGYSAAILLRRAQVAVMAGVLTGLYTFLYLTLKAENYALLAGSIGLWVVLASVMYLTRRINWYAAGSGGQKQANVD